MSTPEWIEKGFQTRASEASETDTRARRDKLLRYRPHRPIDLVIVGWLVGWILTPADRDSDPVPFGAAWRYRIRRVKHWIADLYPRFRSFLVAITGPRIGIVIFERRNEICELCPFLRIRLPARRGGKARRYCGSCGCPEWPLAELGWKNRLERWRCPQNLHPKKADWRDELVRQLEETRRRVLEAENTRRTHGDRGNDLEIDNGELGIHVELDKRDPVNRRRTDGR